MRGRTSLLAGIALILVLPRLGSAGSVSCGVRAVRATPFTWVWVFDRRCHVLWPRYWPGGVTIAAARARTPGALHVTTGVYHWRGEPVEHVRIGRLEVRPQTVHPDWPYLAWRDGQLRVNHAPDPGAAWELRGGPLLVRERTVGRSYDARVWRATTQRRAVLWVEGGSGFAVLEGWQNLPGVRVLMRQLGYTHAFFLDGGSSTARSARNPVYFFVFPVGHPLP